MFVTSLGRKLMVIAGTLLLSLSVVSGVPVALASEADGSGVPTGTVVGQGVTGGEASGSVDATNGKKQVPKPYMPTMVKFVSLGSSGWTDTVDASVGDTIGYKLVGTLPEKLAEFQTYPYGFSDMPEESVVVDASSVRVARVRDSVETDVTSAFTITVADGSVGVSCPDVKAAIADLEATDRIVVTYSAKLSEPSVGLADPNENKAHVTYTDTNGEPQDTPDDVTFVYSCALQLTKVEKGKETPLSGAKFALKAVDGGWFDGTGFSGTETSRKVLVTDEKGRLEVSGLGAGNYQIYEVEAPSGYEALSGPVELVITRGEDGEGRASLTATARGAEVTSVSADTGLVSVKVEDPTKTTSSGSGNDVQPASTTRGGSSGSSGGSSGGGGSLSKTGDETSYVPVVVMGVIGVVVVSAGAIAHRRRES